VKVNITRRNLSIYIKESSTHNIARKKEYYIYEDILVLVKDPVPYDIDLYSCLREVEARIPRHLIYGLDSIFVGQFPEFEKQEINAFYKDGAIYITNDQETDDDFIDDLIHEIAHLAEKTYGADIYGDQSISREFLGKRQKLFYMLKEEGFDVSPKDFMSLDYSFEFDMFLLKKIGYPMLTQLTIGLFLTPYGITSLAEYFAESFEFYILRDQKSVKEISPMCFVKIKELMEVKDAF
jgi:hypothetical protein|tara:strand:- start:672 stop:1382 length:711 start_codon:yes stop_codon:yes gene_type:complete